MSSLLLFAADDFDDLAKRAEDALDENPAQAAALYKQALALRPTWVEGWLYLGAACFQTGQFKESRDALRKGVDLDASKGTAWAYLGMAEYELGEFDQALADIVKGESIGLANKAVFVEAVRYRAAVIYLRASDFTRAIEQLRPLVRAGNDSPKVIRALGIASLSMQNLPEEVPANKLPLVQLAGHAAAAFLAERADVSQPLFEQLAKQFPLEPGVHYMYGVFLLDRDPLASEAEFRKELRITPSNFLACIQLATLLTQRGNAPGAILVAREAVRIKPDSALCHVTLGRALLAGDQVAPAIASLEKAAQLAPAVPQTHHYLQQAYQRAGRTSDAHRERAEFDRLRAEQQPITIADPSTSQPP